MLTHTPGKKVPLKLPSKFDARFWKAMHYGALAGPIVGCGAAVAGMPEAGLLTTLGATVLHYHAHSKLPRPLFWPKRGETSVTFGTDEFGLDVHIPLQELTRHMLLLGTTGSGKTTLLRFLVHTLLKQGGGVTFVDGKADVADMYAIFYSLVADADRTEDLFVINFLNPDQSHTFNPFKYGDADFLSEVLAGLLSGRSGSGDSGEYWQGRGKVMMRALMTVLVWLRDNRGLSLDIGTIREGITLQRMAALGINEDIPLEDGAGCLVRRRLTAYLDELGPDWKLLNDPNADLQARQSNKSSIEQHGYAVQQWSEPLDLLSGRYRKIFMAEGKESDIDMTDILSNSRVLYVLLPSLELSPGTLRGLGRLILSTFKIAFTSTLGKEVLGDFGEVRRKIYARRPDPPHLLIADEYGSYAVEGFDTVLAQARSLGLGVVISVQELASLFKANEQEARRLIGNTNVKVALKIEDPDTARYLVERSGEDWVFVPAVREIHGALSSKTGNVDGSFQYQKQSRIDTIDTVHLKPGQGYLIMGSELRRFTYPFVQGKDPEHMVLWSYRAKEEPPPEAPGPEDSSVSAARNAELEYLQDRLGLSCYKQAEVINGLKDQYGYSARDTALMQPLYRRCGNLADRYTLCNDTELQHLLKSVGFSGEQAKALIAVIHKRSRYMEFRRTMYREMRTDWDLPQLLDQTAVDLAAILNTTPCLP